MALFNVGPEELALLSAIIGVGISEKLGDEGQNVVGNFLVSVGSIILTVSAQNEALEKCNKKSKDKELMDRIQALENQLSNIENKLK